MPRVNRSRASAQQQQQQDDLPDDEQDPAPAAAPDVSQQQARRLLDALAAEQERRAAAAAAAASVATVNQPTSDMKKAARGLESLDGRKARAWTLRFERSMDIEAASSTQRLKLVPMCLSGAAAIWHEQLTTANSPALHDWTSYKKLLVHVFDPPPTSAQAMASLGQCHVRSGESIATHQDRFRECVANCGQHCPAAFITQSYLNAMRPATRSYLLTVLAKELNDILLLTPLDWSDLATQARVWESASSVTGENSAMADSSNRASQSPSRSPFTRASPVSPASSAPTPMTVQVQTTYPHSSPVAPSIGVNAPASSRVNVHYRGRHFDRGYVDPRRQPGSASSQEQQSAQTGGQDNTKRKPLPISDVECYNCHKLGHFANTCREPKRVKREQGEVEHG